MLHSSVPAWAPRLRLLRCGGLKRVWLRPGRRQAYHAAVRTLHPGPCKRAAPAPLLAQVWLRPGDASLITLHGSLLQEWSLAMLRAPLWSADLAPTAVAAAAAAGIALWQPPGSVPAANSSAAAAPPLTCSLCAAPDGERLAVAAGGDTGGVVLLYDIRRLGGLSGGDEGSGEAQVLAADAQLAGGAVLAWHPSRDTLLVAGKAAGSVLALQLAL